jgi:hypothetical protein
MDIAHPGWEAQYIAQADAYCARQSSQPFNMGPMAPVEGQIIGSFIPTDDRSIAQFFGSSAPTMCGAWLGMDDNQRMLRATAWGTSRRTFDRSTTGLPASPVHGARAFVTAVNNYCLRRPHTATAFSGVRPRF